MLKKIYVFNKTFFCNKRSYANVRTHKYIGCDTYLLMLWHMRTNIETQQLALILKNWHSHLCELTNEYIHIYIYMWALMHLLVYGKETINVSFDVIDAIHNANMWLCNSKTCVFLKSNHFATPKMSYFTACDHMCNHICVYVHHECLYVQWHMSIRAATRVVRSWCKETYSSPLPLNLDRL